MLRIDSLRNKPQVIVFDILDTKPNSPQQDKNLEAYNAFLLREDIDIIKTSDPLYCPPPMFPDPETGSSARMLVHITYKKKKGK